MNSPASIATLQEVMAVAAETELPLTLDAEEGVLRTKVTLPDGRCQTVLVRCAGRTFQDLRIVTVFSACAVRPKSLAHDFDATMLRDLLRRNLHIHFGRFGIWDRDHEEQIIVSCDQIVETMEAEELAALVRYVASIADDYERQGDRDVF